MVTVDKIFAGVFNNSKITSERLLTFSIDSVSKTSANNPAGVYDGILSESNAKITALQNALNSNMGNKATGKGGTVDKNAVRSDCERFISQNEGLVKYHYAVSSGVYKEFYPQGIRGFRNASDADFRTRLNVFAEKASKYAVTLGADFKDAAAAKRDAFIDAMDGRVGNDSDIISSRSALQTAVREMGIQMSKNVLTIAANNLGNMNAADLYFNTRLLFPASHQGTFHYSIPINGVLSVLVHPRPGGKMTITKTGAAGMGTFCSSIKDTFQGNMQQVDVNSPINVMYDSYNVDLITHTYIVFQNQSATDALSFKVVFD